MYTGAGMITQTGQDLPAGTPRRGAAMTCLSTQCPATLQDHRDRQFRTSPDDGMDSAHMKQPKFSHTSTHTFPRWFWHPHGETPQPRVFAPIHHKFPFTLHHPEKPNRENQPGQGVHTPSWLLPVPLHAMMSLRL